MAHKIVLPPNPTHCPFKYYQPDSMGFGVNIHGHQRISKYIHFIYHEYPIAMRPIVSSRTRRHSHRERLFFKLFFVRVLVTPNRPLFFCFLFVSQGPRCQNLSRWWATTSSDSVSHDNPDRPPPVPPPPRLWSPDLRPDQSDQPLSLSLLVFLLSSSSSPSSPPSSENTNCRATLVAVVTLHLRPNWTGLPLCGDVKTAAVTRPATRWRSVRSFWHKVTAMDKSLESHHPRNPSSFTTCFISIPSFKEQRGSIYSIYIEKQTWQKNLLKMCNRAVRVYGLWRVVHSGAEHITKCFKELFSLCACFFLSNIAQLSLNAASARLWLNGNLTPHCGWSCAWCPLGCKPVR